MEGTPLLGPRSPSGGGPGARSPASPAWRGAGALCGARRAQTLAGAAAAGARGLGVDAGDLADELAALGAALDAPPPAGGPAALWAAAFCAAEEAEEGAAAGTGAAPALPPAPAGASADWGLLGFQGADPATDLRSGSAGAALRLAARALGGSRALRAEAARGALGAAPPLALAALNATHALAAHLHAFGAGAPPPPMCPCCGAAIRRAEYETRAAQTHGGAALAGFVALVAEEMRAAERAPLARAAGAPPPLAPAEAAFALLLELLLLRLGAAWRAAGADGALGAAPPAELRAALRAAHARGARAGVGDARQLAFPRLLAEARAAALDALAAVARGARGARGGGGGRPLRRAVSEGGDADAPRLRFRGAAGVSYRGAVEVGSPLESARAAAEGGEEAPVRAFLRQALEF